MTQLTYDAKDVVVTVNGSVISGFGADAVVNITANSDNYTQFTGADRQDNTRSRSADNSGTIEITLAQTSASNAVMTELIKQDKQDNSGLFDVSVLAPDGSCSGSDSWINNRPDATYTVEANGDRVYSIIVPDMNQDFSGQ